MTKEFAYNLVEEIKGKKVRVVQPDIIKRGIPLEVLKMLTPNQIKRLEKQMKGGK